MTTGWMSEDVQQLSAKGLRRHLTCVESAQSRVITIKGQRALNFCSNNYLGLADDPRLVEAAVSAMSTYGFGSGASRLVNGNMPPHQALEAGLAQWKQVPSALVFNSGWNANAGVIPALLGRDDIIFSDRLNHASIVDGIILSRAEFKRYAHKDMSALESGLKDAAGFRRRLIVTDTVFSMDGDVAPLADIVELARRYDAMVMVDEAHAVGVLGLRGGGLADALGLSSKINIQMGTLSKAAGCFGAYVCGDNDLREYLINHARSFIYTTAMPPALAAAALCAVQIINSSEGAQLRQTLKENAATLRQGLNNYDASQKDCLIEQGLPIIPIMVKDAVTAVAMSARLLELGIFVQAIRPPTVPVNSARLRVTVMATHTREDLDYLIKCFGSL